ncbi:MAG: hypothetical protein AAF745_06670 [Planctomycetota bacterium]
MPILPTPFGHVGVFPEQHVNWHWLESTRPDLDASKDPPAGLNLFAYTGASTMAMVASGMAVAHVDAAKPNVLAARKTAAINGFSDRPIRYLVDDAAQFAARERRRGRTYHTIVLDPPAYGHAPKGRRRSWRLERDLWPLLDDCVALLRRDQFRLLITGHSSNLQPSEIASFLQQRLTRVGLRPFDVESGRLKLTDRANRELDAGYFVRCIRA